MTTKDENRLNSGEWTRGLVNAHSDGDISPGACNTGLRLATAINWAPTKRSRPGLYWSIAAAREAVGVSLSTWKRHRKELLDAGLLMQWSLEGNDYVPWLPPKYNRPLVEGPP